MFNPLNYTTHLSMYSHVTLIDTSQGQYSHFFCDQMHVWLIECEIKIKMWIFSDAQPCIKKLCLCVGCQASTIVELNDIWLYVVKHTPMYGIVQKDYSLLSFHTSRVWNQLFFFSWLPRILIFSRTFHSSG